MTTAREAKRHIRRQFTFRAIARLFDLGLYVVLTRILLDLFFRIKAEPIWRGWLLAYTLPILLMFFIEPLMLSAFSFTPGKWLLGLRVLTDAGRRLSFGKAFQRTLHVFRDGLGWWIPFFNLFLLSQLRQRVIRDEAWPWDDGLTVRYQAKRWRQTISLFLGVAFLVAAMFIISAEKQLPYHRGAISAAQYVDNVNDLILRLSPGYDAVMREDGSWSEGETVRQDPRWIPLPLHHLIEEDGILQAVIIEAKVNADLPLTGFIDQKALAYIAFVGAAPGYTSLFMQNDEVRYALSHGFSSFQKEQLGIEVIQNVTYTGYEKEGHYLVPLAAEDREFLLDFRLRRRVTD